MKTRTFLVSFLALLTAAWAWNALYTHPMSGDWPWVLRQHGIYLTGIWSISLMSLVMILATRPARLENLLGGMDKIYQVHKWGGILAISSGALHWLIKLASGPMKEIIAATGRPEKELVISFMQPLRSNAKDLGEIALYLLLGLLVLALWKRFPYRPWRLLHKIMPLLYLMLVFHSIALMPLAYWSGPTGLLQAVLLGGGTAAAAIAIAQRIGRRRQHKGRIETVRQHADVLEVVCDPGPDWPAHRPGQFAFVTFDRLEGAHPFTIASAPRPQSRLITFQIKALGDYTHHLAQRLRAGQPVTLEGPYGRLDWHDGRKDATQVWVAGGIGVTPFLAWLESMQQTPTTVPVQMHYCVRHAADDPFVRRMQDLCAALPNVELHVHDASRAERLDAGTLLAGGRPGNGKMDVWFCGPAGFARSLDTGLRRHLGGGLRMHREAFDMR